MTTSIEDIVKYFNSTLLDFGTSFGELFPKSTIGKNIKEIKLAFKILGNKTDYIDIFVEKVLIHKDKIDRKDEKFFVDSNYENETGALKIIKEIKGIWTTLDSSNKNVIWEYMDQLCMMAQDYFMMNLDKSKKVVTRKE